MKGLCGSQKVTLEQLEKMPAVKSERLNNAGNSSWEPLLHPEIISIAKTAIKEAGLKIKNEEYIGSHYDENIEGFARMFGVLEIEGHNHLDNKVALMMGLRNSVDKSLSVGVCFGSKVFVCDNLIFTAYVNEDENGQAFITKRKHTDIETTRVDVIERLHKSISRYGVVKDAQEQLYRRLMETKLNEMEVHDMLVKSVMKDVIPRKDILNVRENYFNDIEAKGKFPESTAWSLFNAYTENAKGYQAKNPFVSSDRGIALTGFFKEEFMN